MKRREVIAFCYHCKKGIRHWHLHHRVLLDDPPRIRLAHDDCTGSESGFVNQFFDWLSQDNDRRKYGKDGKLNPR